MMKNVFTMKKFSVALLLGAAVLYSCKKDNEATLSATDSQVVGSESVSASTSSETSDLGNSVISNVSDTRLSTARDAGDITGSALYNSIISKDKRLTGATITIAGTGTKTSPSGTVTINYGAGVTTDGITRRGIIRIVYSGRRLQPNSTRTISFDGFYRNDVKVEGSYGVTVMDSTVTGGPNPTDVIITFKHITQLTLTFKDATTITRTATFYVVWDYKIGAPLQSTVTHKAGSTAAGTNRRGKSYEMAITKDVVYRLECLASGFVLPVSGTQTVTTESRIFTIDYGTTDCDNTVTVTIDGKNLTVTVGSDGN